jgi:hypothetical protein
MAQSHAAATDHLEKLVNTSPQFAELYQKMLEDHGRKYAPFDDWLRSMKIVPDSKAANF